MPRIRLLVLAALFALAGWSYAQPRFPPPGAPNPARLQGTWFYEGNRFQPTHIDVGPGGRLSLTNEEGSEASGHISWGGRIVADDWGGLVGTVGPNIIRWHNGTFWTR